MGIKVEFVVINWDNKFIELNSGTIDCIWNGMTVSIQLKQTVTFLMLMQVTARL